MVDKGSTDAWEVKAREKQLYFGFMDLENAFGGYREN